MENQPGSSQPASKKLPRAVVLLISPALPLALLFVLCASLSQTSFVHAQGSVLTEDILADYNLVVDSNVGSPATAGPSAATVIARICNTGSSAIIPIPPPAATPIPTPAVQYLPETGGDSPATGTAPWWVIVVALTVLVIELGSRAKRGR